MAALLLLFKGEASLWFQNQLSQFWKLLRSWPSTPC